MLKHTKHAGILLAACMLAGSCTAPFSASAEQNPEEIKWAEPSWGDADRSGRVDVADAVLIARFCVSDPLATITDTGRANSDVNGNGKIDTDDIREILDFIAKKRTQFSVEAEQPVQKLTKTVNMLDGIESTTVQKKEVDDVFRKSQFDMTANLLRETAKQSDKGANLMISPLSFSQALSMAANGAKGDTLDEITKLLGGELDMDTLNQYYSSYVADLPQSEEAKLDIANASWFIDDANKLSIPQTYLQTIRNYYVADVYRSPFNDQTVTDINEWVNKKTNSMIPSIIEELDPRSIFVLVNALYFDAKWEKPYLDTSIDDRWFYLTEGADYRTAYAQYGTYAFDLGAAGQTDWNTLFDESGQYTGGNEQSEDSENAANSSSDTPVKVKLMNSTEHTYLENDSVTGFMRPYKGEEYSFVGLLPKGDKTAADCIAELDGDSLKALFDQKANEKVIVTIPKFSDDYSVDLIPVMKNLGIEKAFNPFEADFTGLNAHGMTWIGTVIQKTRIEVDEKGTRASAATGIGGLAGSPRTEEPKRVRLDHPFIYMIVDNETDLPLFIGYVMNPLA